MDNGYRLVSVPRLVALCDPFEAPPWEGVARLTVEGVREAIRDSFFQPQEYSVATRPKAWSVEQHIARIAYLAAHGWEEPIEVDVGVPSLRCYVNWPVTDGNHRLAAAVVREDKFILSSVGGCCATMRQLFGRMYRPKPTIQASRISA